MAKVANCPQCEHELLVPEDAAASAWSRCPSCRAFFKLTDATTREVSTIEIVDEHSAPDPQTEELAREEAAQTIADISSQATWSGEANDDLDLDLSDFAKEFDKASAGGDVGSDDAESLDIAAEDDDLELAAEEDARDAFPSTPAPKETPETAAQRIDAWFKSAKTLPDLPPVTEELIAAEAAHDEPEVDFLDSKYLGDDEVAFIGTATKQVPANNEHADDDLADLGLGDDLQPVDSKFDSDDLPTWDDSQHMDRLLAGLQSEPQDEFVPSSRAADADEVAAEPVAAAATADQWSPAEPVSVASTGGKRQRSSLRMLLAVALGGLMAIPLAGYALLWIGGPAADFVGVADFLPKALLPASFSKSTPVATTPAIRPEQPETPSEPVAEPVADTPADSPAEQQASYTEPADVKKIETPADDRYATATPPEHPAEPAELNPPAAEPMKEHIAPAEPIHIGDAPSFKPADLAAALEMGKEAEANLVKGSMSDGVEIARAKGMSYAKLADLAQKVVFVDAADPEEAAKLEHETDALFRSVFASPHTREEVGQIVPMWIASPKRTHGGVFFAGSLTGHDPQGAVAECRIDLGSGQPMTVLIPAAAAEQLKESHAPVAVVGWLVDDPAKKVGGYSGDAPQAVFATKLIPLQ